MHPQNLQCVKQYPPNPNQFPWQAFPPVMAGAIYDVWTRTKAPVPLVASSVLSACSLTCQQKFEVRLPFGAISPLSLYLLLFAVSGERKSAADALVYRLIAQLEKEQRIEFLREQESYRLKIASWSLIEKALKRKILRADSEDMIELQKQFENHYSQKPIKPREIKYMLDNVTPEAIINGLSKFQSMLLTSNDGKTMLTGRALGDLSLLNRAWERAVLRVDRVGSEAVVLDDYDLSLWIMVQPGVLDKFMKTERGELSRDTGLFGRCLIAYPESTQGTRYFDPLTFQPEAGLNDFHRCQEEIFKQTATRQLIELDDAAIEIWTRFHNDVERDLLPGQCLSDLTDFASKAPENVARVAAIFHVMTRRSGPLQADHMRQACELVTWYLLEAKRLFGTPLISQEASDAEALAQWMLRRIVWPNTFADFSKEFLYTHGPRALRDRRRLDPALSILEYQGKLSRWYVGKKAFFRYTMLNA